MATASSTLSRAAKDASGTFAEGVRDAGASAKQAIADRLETVRETATDYFKQGKDSARHFGESVQKHVSEQPVKAVLIAAAAGLFVGVLLMRRK